MITNKLKEDAGITITDTRERELLFASLYLSHGMWSDSFIVSEDGWISPNLKWWRARKIFTAVKVVEVFCFCEGWIAGRCAEATEKEVLEMGHAKPDATRSFIH